MLRDVDDKVMLRYTYGKVKLEGYRLNFNDGRDNEVGGGIYYGWGQRLERGFLGRFF